MDVYASTTASWLALQAVPLILFPRSVISILSSEMHKYPTPLETYFSRTLGFSLLAIAVTMLLLTGIIPLSTISQPISLEESDLKAPYAVPTVLVTSLFHTTCAIYLYLWYSDSGQAGFLLGLLGYSGLAMFGLWCIMFGTGPGRISKRTGADKRTSGFPFKNLESDKKKFGRQKGL